MKTGRFSISTLLLLTTILAMAVHTFHQHKTLEEFRTQNLRFRDELGKFDACTNNDNIQVRPLLNRGANTWRFRIDKKGTKHQYGYGIVDVDKNGKLIFPERRNRFFQWMPTNVEGESELTFSIRADNKANWYMFIFEYSSYGVKSSNARLSKFTFAPEPDVWNFLPPVTIVNDIPTMRTDGQSNGPVSQFASNETVVLFRSQSLAQPGNSARAFVVVFRKTPEGKAR